MTKLDILTKIESAIVTKFLLLNRNDIQECDKHTLRGEITGLTYAKSVLRKDPEFNEITLTEIINNMDI